ncbi:MAG: hypothetical protein KF859_06965 [Phycisphaeraceae bacterium]|nr:hypothetical protein [Phycisphaeraceae bacterium]
MFARMIRWLSLALACALAAMSPRAAAQIDIDQVAGQWAGDWKGSGESGWVQFTLDADGTFLGIAVVRSRGIFGNIQGIVGSSGVFAAEFESDGALTPITGTLGIRRGTLPGKAQYTTPEGKVIKVGFTLRQWNPGALPPVARFAGTWGGAWNAKFGRGLSRVEIDPEGNLSAGVFDTTSGESSTIEGRVFANGVFAGRFTDDLKSGYMVVGDIKAGKTTLAASLAGEPDTGKPIPLKATLRPQVPGSYAGEWRGTARAGKVSFAVELSIAEDGYAHGAVYELEDGAAGSMVSELSLGVLTSGDFAGLSTGEEGSAIFFGKIKRRTNLTLTGVATEIFGAAKTRLSLTLAPAQ